MYFSYETLKTYSPDPSKFNTELFRLLLLKSRITVDTASVLNKYIIAGKSLYELDKVTAH